MRRISITPRAGWQRTIESQGLTFARADEKIYWEESAFYAFSRLQIERIEAASDALNEMCLQAVQVVIDEDLWGEFAIPQKFVPWVKQSWETDEQTIYGRFDFVYNGRDEPKLLEYNADTPTSLLEAAVIQWFWLQDWKETPSAQDILHEIGAVDWDQFNMMHERLIEAWAPFKNQTIYFSAIDIAPEDVATVDYLRETAAQAGVKTELLPVHRIGWNRNRRVFVDAFERPIERVFKLYPWEWMLREPFGAQLPQAKTRWLEAPWKMLLSNKALLPLLWRMFPESPYLLRAEWRPWSDTYVCKPIFAREGNNIRVVENNRILHQTGGPYEGGPMIYQEWCPLPEFDGSFAVVGSWMVNGYSAGIGIREDSLRITGNDCRFVPHAFWNA